MPKATAAPTLIFFTSLLRRTINCFVNIVTPFFANTDSTSIASVTIRTSLTRFLTTQSVPFLTYDDASSDGVWIAPPEPFNLSFTYTQNGLTITVTNTSNRQNEYRSHVLIVNDLGYGIDNPVGNYTFPAAGTYSVAIGGLGHPSAGISPPSRRCRIR